uniref:Uncharacterized protein n=1 Tax=Brassica oleracea TaxID=3712 RepID=A0A3P6FQP1_BRAOL|nr:unnamed protein product [Brassica oleracea]
MANSCILLGDLKAGRCTNTVVVHLLRFWEAEKYARNVNKNGDLMGPTLIQGCISRHQLNIFQQLSKE